MNLALLPLAAPPPPPTPSPPLQAIAAWPLQPRPDVVRGFELPAKPWLPGHRGVDLAGHPGQPVLAATPGTITYAGALAGRGVITITTGPLRTTYEPVIPEVSVGATVKTGTVIGRLSAAGSHCLPRSCLHWGLLQGKQYLNPLTLLPNRPVRLLPLTEERTRSAGQAPRGTSPDLSPDPASEVPPDSNRRAAKLVIAATAALTLTAGLLIRRE
ncbi:M23 family metallopeptidase [Kribbella soli]|uniref:M23 family metallopeptidase n=1 Tax=Kribbella soli TaxID=1124743 RepID=A0A4R0H0B1_9ACTN|nr:M23 family metallopeptidase [Kribbella soli]TCC02928.1 M23 family metallopeptidase [Kribbella soli]